MGITDTGLLQERRPASVLRFIFRRLGARKEKQVFRKRKMSLGSGALENTMTIVCIAMLLGDRLRK